MEVFLISVVSAFLLFAVILPLTGIVLGLFCYYILPYVFGGLVTIALLFVAGVKVLFALWLWLVAVLWASAVFFGGVAQLGVRHSLPSRRQEETVVPALVYVLLPCRTPWGDYDHDVSTHLQGRLGTYLLYYSDGVVLGSKEFVNGVFDRHRAEFGVKRETGARQMKKGDWGGLCTMRDLRLEVVSLPQRA